MAPTSIDGNEITGATIDGQEVSEITVDGDVVFTAGPDIPDSGVSRWTFDKADTESGTAIDTWGNNDASITGAATGAAGIAGYDSGEAYSFNPSNNDYVDAGGDSSLKGTPFSFTFWMKLDDTSADSRFGGTFSNDKRGWLSRYDGPNSQWKFEWGDGIAFNSLTGPSQSSGTNVFNAVTVGSGTVDVYRNDAVNIISGSVNIATGTNNLYIGRGPAFGSTVAGDMDDPRYFSKKLSATEVSNLYNTGSI